MAASSGEEYEEYEYEEIEVEVEEEEEEEDVEEIEEIGEGEEEEEIEEVEEEEEEEEEEEVEEIVEEEEDDPEEEEEEEEEEEYEEVVEEIEVTDDEEMEEAAEEAAIAMAEKEVAVQEAVAVAEEAKVESVVGSSDSPITVIDHQQNDVRQDEQTKGNEVRLSSRLQDTVDSKVAASVDIHAFEAIGSMLGSLSPTHQKRKGKEVLSIDDGSSNMSERLKSVSDPPKLGGNTAVVEHGLVDVSPPAPPVKDEQTHDKNIIPAGTSENLVSAHDGGIHDKLHKIETTEIEMTSVSNQREDLHFPSHENMNQKALRYYTPQIRPRSLSPKAESEVVSKRTAMVCEFFAKGWCIKGSTCRFLHKRDEVDYAGGQVEGDGLPTKGEICPAQGSEDAAGASNSLAHHRPKYVMRNIDDMFPISSVGRYTEDDHREHVNDTDNSRRSIGSQKSPPSKDGPKLVSSENKVEVDMFKEKRSSDYLDHHGSSVTFGGSTLHENITPGHGFLPQGRGVTSGAETNNSLHSNTMLEESVAKRRQYHMDPHSSSVYGFSAKAIGSLRNASLLDYSSLKDLLSSYKNNRTFTPYNWEPSVPFRPSHFVLSSISLSANVPYDPLRDCIEQPELGHGSFRHSSYSQTQGLTYQHAGSISGRNSQDSRKRLHSDSNYKDYDTHDKDAPIVEAESAAISATGAENKNISDEENRGVVVSVKDVLKATRSITDDNSKLKIDDSRHKGETKRHANDLDEEESKVIRIFRAALIEFVKELMKPVWHEGRLSKDVYKVIVQKAEDKILSTLPSNEVPNTPESIKQYLSSSRPNILKLIQAYVDKYGNF